MTSLAPSSLASLRPGLLAAAGFSAVISVLMLTGSIYMLQVYDRVLLSGSIPTLLALFAIVVVLHIFLALYDGLRMRLLSRLAFRLDANLAPAAFRAGLGRQGGQALRDLETVRGFLSGPVMLALFDLPFVVLFLAVLFVIHPHLGWLTVGGIAIAALLAGLNWAVTHGPLRAATGHEESARDFGALAQRAGPTLGALGMVGSVTRHWLGMHNVAQAISQRGSEPSVTIAAAARSLRMLLQSALLTTAAWLVIQGEISAGAIIASSILAGRALMPVDQLIGQWRSLARASEARRRLDVLPRSETPTRRVSLPRPSGAVVVEGLTRYAPARAGQDTHPADRIRLLDNVAFTLSPGEGLGVVGASASGKSTLARLLVGVLAPDAGEIRFDGATRDQWDPDRLGAHVGYLPQQIDLLPGTVRDNIARFDPDATDAAVIAAAEAAGILAMVLSMPDGFDTKLGHADLPLSGGQVQRIGLARALYGDPAILVLDEPNAHLDQAGEAALTRALLARRAAGATVIVMAHRAGALAAIGTLMVLQAGRVVQAGPRDEVLTLLDTTRRGTAVPAQVAATAQNDSNSVGLRRRAQSFGRIIRTGPPAGQRQDAS
ncbi:MAG: type I secretion system permease/ATPase [Gemmobacter sp.]